MSAPQSFPTQTARVQPPPSRRGGLPPWQARRARRFIAENLSRPLALAELAEACGLSRSHFSAAFRETFGCPPHRWLLLQRVERAKHLLLTSGRTLREIAIDVGFADQSHLTRVFTRHVKVSPGAWRRRRRHDPGSEREGL
ncbi:MAG: AraC family transcriptional regulator [Rhizomicrobium sp.]